MSNQSDEVEMVKRSQLLCDMIDNGLLDSDEEADGVNEGEIGGIPSPIQHKTTIMKKQIRRNLLCTYGTKEHRSAVAKYDRNRKARDRQRQSLPLQLALEWFADHTKNPKIKTEQDVRLDYLREIRAKIRIAAKILGIRKTTRIEQIMLDSVSHL